MSTNNNKKILFSAEQKQKDELIRNFIKTSGDKCVNIFEFEQNENIKTSIQGIQNLVKLILGYYRFSKNSTSKLNSS